MSNPKVIRMPPKVEPDDGVLFEIGDEAFRLTAHVEKVTRREPGQLVPIDGAKKQPE